MGVMLLFSPLEQFDSIYIFPIELLFSKLYLLSFNSTLFPLIIANAILLLYVYFYNLEQSLVPTF